MLTLLLVICTGKVFSPQYLIWIIPLAAYVGQSKPNWIVSWCLLGGLTTLIFPYLYMAYMDSAFDDISSAPLFFLGIALRNLFLLGLLVSLLVSYSRQQPGKTS